MRSSSLLKFNNSRQVDKPFLIVFLIILIAGLFIFFSASFGLLARDDIQMSSVIRSQLIFGVFLGGVLCFLFSRLHYNSLRKLSLVLFVFAIFLNLIIFIPGLGLTHGGATRWLDLGITTFQPAELLKLAFIIYFASWLSGSVTRLNQKQFGLLPAILILGVFFAILILQRDTDNAIIMGVVGLAMFLVGGGKLKDFLILSGIGLLAIVSLVYYRPYIKERILDFFNIYRDTQGSSYQINQSLITIGSGGLFGKGFGQSIQKFGKLPEPIGDSVFAVAGEEFGFVGLSFLVLLFCVFGILGIRISIRSPDLFSRLISFGIVILIVLQSFFNMATMLGLVPLSGLTLVFVSHGGSSLAISLIAVGIVLGVSRYAK